MARKRVLEIAPRNISKEAAEEFLRLLQEETESFQRRISTETGDWIVRGFIDVFRRVYTISGDTKVVSKLIELMLLPCFREFAERYGYELVLAREQNHYPDMSFVREDGVMFAVDLKSTYRIDGDRVNTMTLGAFTGYFRDRSSISTTTFPYGHYSGHIVLGVLYDRAKIRADELQIHVVEELGGGVPLEVGEAEQGTSYSIDRLESIPSVVRNLHLFAQPKYRIAIDRPGSGNTKNIGAINSLKQLQEGSGPFARLGEELFDEYWSNYQTKQDAKAGGLEAPPYSNLTSFGEYRNIPAAVQAAREAGLDEAIEEPGLEVDFEEAE